MGSPDQKTYDTIPPNVSSSILGWAIHHTQAQTVCLTITRVRVSACYELLCTYTSARAWAWHHRMQHLRGQRCAAGPCAAAPCRHSRDCGSSRRASVKKTFSRLHRIFKIACVRAHVETYVSYHMDPRANATSSLANVCPLPGTWTDKRIGHHAQ